jgi:hypothetical protein
MGKRIVGEGEGFIEIVNQPGFREKRPIANCDDTIDMFNVM